MCHDARHMHDTFVAHARHMHGTGSFSSGHSPDAQRGVHQCVRLASPIPPEYHPNITPIQPQYNPNITPLRTTYYLLLTTHLRHVQACMAPRPEQQGVAACLPASFSILELAPLPQLPRTCPNLSAPSYLPVILSPLIASPNTSRAV